MGDTEKGKTLRIRQVRSGIGTVSGHREVLRGLGLRRIRHQVEHEDSPTVRGMIKAVVFAVKVDEA